jgi:hypothetical protein
VSIGILWKTLIISLIFQRFKSYFQVTLPVAWEFISEPRWPGLTVTWVRGWRAVRPEPESAG